MSRDGARQGPDSGPGPVAASTPRAGGPRGCGQGTNHAGPDESSGAFPKGRMPGISIFREYVWKHTIVDCRWSAVVLLFRPLNNTTVT